MKIINIIFILLAITSCAQNKYSEKDLLNEKEKTLSMILKLNEIRKTQKLSNLEFKNTIDNKYFKISNLAKDSPNKYGKLANYSNQIYNSGNEIYLLLNNIKNEITNESDENNYIAMTDTISSYNIIVEKFPGISKKINNFYLENIKITKSYNRVYNYNNNFNINNNFRNSKGKKVNYTDYKFNNKTSIGVLASLEKLQFEIRYFQLIFFNAIVQ